MLFLLVQDGISGLGVAEETKMTERLHQNEARVEELTKNWTSKWRETQKIIEVKPYSFSVVLYFYFYFLKQRI